MNTTEIRQCLEHMEIDTKLIEHFVELLTIIRTKALNGQRAAALRLHELLIDAVSIDPACTDAYGILEQALEEQICKTKASLKRYE